MKVRFVFTVNYTCITDFDGKKRMLIRTLFKQEENASMLIML